MVRAANCFAARTILLQKENDQWFSKAFAMPSPSAGSSPPSDEGGGFAVGEDGGRETRSEN